MPDIGGWAHRPATKRGWRGLPGMTPGRRLLVQTDPLWLYYYVV
jgi:hypothetical protein